MPKVGMEPIRREALVQATIDEIGAAGTLEVSVSRIARRAGMSSGLAHHYFGNKEQMFLAAMRHILSEYARLVRAALAGAGAPQDRLEAIIRANFAQPQFSAPVVNAWMTFYAQAQNSPSAARLLRIYRRRLHSNLLHALRPHAPDSPERVAETLAALIDGVYIRAAIDGQGVEAEASEIVLAAARALTGPRP